ncbi:N-lysine methyltransferase KMT5A-like [Lineus longissimus]|uniref:N-lysine methyltransferase KMT5A-like n=1 Tax=Lineus longissimus TaxID=88925 RepID=UPI00315DB727
MEVHLAQVSKNTLNLEVREIDDVIGKGLFTTSKMKAGECLAEYKGELIDGKEAEKREERYRSNKHSYLYHFSESGETMCIDATNHDEHIARYANDEPQKTATAFVKKTLIHGVPCLLLFAKKDLSPNVEVRYDYGDKAAPWREKAPVMPLV